MLLQWSSLENNFVDKDVKEKMSANKSKKIDWWFWFVLGSLVVILLCQIFGGECNV